MKLSTKTLAITLTAATVSTLWLFSGITGDLLWPLAMFTGGLGLCALVAIIECIQEKKLSDYKDV